MKRSALIPQTQGFRAALPHLWAHFAAITAANLANRVLSAASQDFQRFGTTQSFTQR